MTNRLLSIFLLILSLSFFSCDFITNSLTYKDTTENFVKALVNKDYDKSLSYMAIDNKAFEKTNIDTLKLGLANFENLIVKNFGKDLDFKFMTANKTFSTIEGNSTAPNTTKAQIQFSNKQEFGVFEIIFDDTNNKILNIKMLDIKEKIPNMTFFWLFGILVIGVLFFNVWVIRKIKRSNLKKKWLKYLAVVFFNVPTLTYNAIHGLSFEPLSFQILFGISFGLMGYLGSTFSFGIPLGGLYWLWKLNKNKEDNI